MLSTLAIRDFVVVRSLDLEPGPGFTALTGETGAGKSVMLAALSFALGGLARQDRIRPGAEAASVVAVFDPPRDHAVRAWLAERGIAIPEAEPLVFRRTVRRGGSARAFLNDQPVSAATLAEAGALLIEIHGQHSSVGLLDPARHRALLDAFANAGALKKDVAARWTVWRDATGTRKELEARLARAGAERVYLEHALEELDALSPGEGECARLALDRATMQAGERVAEAIGGAADALQRAGVEHALSAAARSVGRALGQPALEGEGADTQIATRLHAAADALDRALIEASEARLALGAAQDACAFSPAALEASEVRLFALRAAARKHNVDPDALPGLRARLRAQIDGIAQADNALAEAMAAEAAAEAAWAAAADRLSARRAAAGKRLAAVVGVELPALHFARARFRVALAPRAEPGPQGREDVVFEIETNAGAGFGSLGSVASGGEAARLALALSVCLADAAPGAALVFDEADAGVGGAVAAAVGERLARLGKTRQVLAITHAPQVAAAAQRQLRLSRVDTGAGVEARVAELRPRERKEEIARMLAGASVTREARAAAGRLLAGA